MARNRLHAPGRRTRPIFLSLTSATSATSAMSLINDKAIDEELLALSSEVASDRRKPAFELTCGHRAIRYRVLAWLTMAAGLAYLCRNAIGVSESAIREELGLTLK